MNAASTFVAQFPYNCLPMSPPLNAAQEIPLPYKLEQQYTNSFMNFLGGCAGFSEHIESSPNLPYINTLSNGFKLNEFNGANFEMPKGHLKENGMRSTEFSQLRASQVSTGRLHLSEHTESVTPRDCSQERPCVCRRRTKRSKKTLQKTWINLLIRAVEEDLARQRKCANACCEALQPKNPRASSWRRRDISGHKEWLCENCARAYDHCQFCEFCFQIYQDETAETAALDGEEWALCEGAEQCGRWAHVKCLARACKKNRNEIISQNFKYVCGECSNALYGKKRRSIKKYYGNNDK